MMQSLFSTVCILLVLVQMAMVHAMEMGYDCNEEFISENRLKEISEEAEAAHNVKHFPSAKKKLSERFEGPPFLKSYLLWPVSSETKIYKMAAKTPYRAVLDDKFQVFSVIMKNRQAVKECRMREESISVNDYRCGGAVYPRGELGDIASQACTKISKFATRWSPARYDGPPYERSGKQLYMAPIDCMELNPYPLLFPSLDGNKGSDDN